MIEHHAIGNWHAEVTRIEIKLRRYPGTNAQALFDKGAEFDAIISADISGDGEAFLSGALVKGPAFSKDDHRTVERLLRLVGAKIFKAKRGGEQRVLPTDFGPL